MSKAGITNPFQIHLKGKWETHEAWLNDVKLDIAKSQKVYNKSNEFAWGYGGSGPAQLAIALCLELFGSTKDYPDFKWTYIAALPQTDFNMLITIDRKGGAFIRDKREYL